MRHNKCKQKLQEALKNHKMEFKLLEPSTTCRICKSMKQVEIDLRMSEYWDFFSIITSAKADDLQFCMICIECNKNLLYIQEFVNTCRASHEYFTEIEAKFPGIESTPDEEFNFISVKTEDSDVDYDEKPSTIIQPPHARKGPPRTRKLPKHVPSYQCDFCQRVFHRKDYLVDHVHTHVARKLHCSLCDGTFKGLKCLKIHWRRRHNLMKDQRENLLQAALKQRPEEVEKEVKVKVPAVVKSRHDKEIVSCEICKIIFTRKDSLVSHMRVIHNPNPQAFTCDICARQLRDRRSLLRHMKSIHLHQMIPSVRKCYLCQKVFETVQELKKHRKEIHSFSKSGNGNVQVGRDKVPCHVCGNLYNRKTIQSHIQLHSDKRDFQCDKCSMSFHMEKGLIAHQQRVHVEGRPFTCEICARTYKSRIDLQRHLKYHNEERETYECTRCNLTFNYKYSYRRHIKLHSGAKPFQCDKCEKVFASQQNLKQHSYSHSGLRPHYCDICEKGFYTRKAANEHKQQVHDVQIQT